MDLYGYCLNDPINWVDPDGENPIVIGSALLGLAALGLAGGMYYNGLPPEQQREMGRALKDLLKDMLNGPEHRAKLIRDLLNRYMGDNACYREKWQPNKPGRKKQGREPGEKKREKPGWKPRNPPKEPPNHTPSKKD